MTEVWTLEQYHAYLAGHEPARTPQPPRFLAIEPDAPEDILRSRVQALCNVTGHLYYHARKSQDSTPGWPDCAIIHPDGGPLYLWEWKRTEGIVSADQHRWLKALDKVTRVETGVYRPADWEALYTLLTRRAV